MNDNRLSWVKTHNGLGEYQWKAVTYIGGKKRVYLIKTCDHRSFVLSVTANDGRHYIFEKKYNNMYEATRAARKYHRSIQDMFMNQYVIAIGCPVLNKFRKINHSTYIAKVCINGHTRTYRINFKKKYPTLEVLGYMPVRKERYIDLEGAFMGADIEHRLLFGNL